MLAVITVVAPVVRRTRKNLDTQVGCPRNKAAHAGNPPNTAENIVALLAAQLAAIRLASKHIQAVMDERSRVINIVALLDVRDKALRKRRRRSAIRHEPSPETESQHEIAELFIGLCIARTLDIHVTVQLEKIHLAVAVKYKREINLDGLHRYGISVLLKILATRHLVDEHL